MKQKPRLNAPKGSISDTHPGGNTGITNGITAPPGVKTPKRPRVLLDLSPDLVETLDYVSKVTGQTRTTVITNCILDMLPLMVETCEKLQAYKAKLGKRG